MDVLPVELQTEILLRLTATTLATTARRVCRLWQSIISDPVFAKDHLIRSIHDEDNTTLLFHRNFCNPDEGLVMYSSDGGDLTPIGPKGILPTPAITHPPITLACNGLVLYIYLERDIIKFYVYNPVLSQYISLEPMTPPSEIIVHLKTTSRIGASYVNWGFGFGFDPITNRYKVVVVSTNPLSKTTSDIYCCTVDVVSEKKTTSSWRKLGRLDRIVSTFTHVIFYDGKLHWSLLRISKEPLLLCEPHLLCVDLNTEEFSVASRYSEKWQTCPIKNKSFTKLNFNNAGYYHWKKNLFLHSCTTDQLFDSMIYFHRYAVVYFDTVRKYFVDVIDEKKLPGKTFRLVSAFVPCLVSLHSRVEFQQH